MCLSWRKSGVKGRFIYLKPIHTQIYIHTHIYIRTHIYTHIYIHIYIFTHTHTYICSYI